MRNQRLGRRICRVVFALLGGVVLSSPTGAFDLGGGFSLGGTLSGVWQVETSGDAEEISRGALVAQPEASFRPTAHDQFFVRLGLAVDNGFRNRDSNRDRHGSGN